MKKIVTVIGARPQFIKAAAVSKTFTQHKDIEEILLHTGQHFDANMSDVFFSELVIPKPTYNLGIGGGLHGAMTGAQLAGIEEVLLKERPDLVLVYGDTNSTLAGALAASKLHIPIAHVEAGLRSFNRQMPEEINRVVTDHISSLLFAPTDSAMQHLSHEGVPTNQCHQVGDVMFDAALIFGERAQLTSTVLERFNISSEKYILTTIHRAENTDDPKRLYSILSALNLVSKDLPVIWPIHPRTRKLVEQTGLLKLLGDKVILTNPVGYLDMVMLEKNAALIATDSGGIQKESFFFSTPCITLRNETEWTELVDSGWNTLISLDNAQNISASILSAIGKRGKSITPYGDGTAGKKIADIVLKA